MAYTIPIKVSEKGRLECEQETLELSVFKESQRVELQFTIDSTIDAPYHYLKFTHEKTSYLYRVNGSFFLVPKAITAYEGLWEMSFVCCDSPANSDNTITSDYIYASEPLACVVRRGNLGITATSEEQRLLKQVVEGTFDRFEIPNGTSEICPYFLADTTNAFELSVPQSVTVIRHHALYQSQCTKIEFEEGSGLKTLEDNALYRISNLGDVKFPRSLSSWGKYNLQGCACTKIEFESNSQLKTLESYALWNIPNVKSIKLPDHLTNFSGKTQVIRSCAELESIWFPATITAVIPNTLIAECPKLTEIVLQANFNVSADFSECTELTHDAIVAMFYALKNLGSGSKELKIGAANLTKVTTDEKQIALDKGWSLA